MSNPQSILDKLYAGTSLSTVESQGFFSQVASGNIDPLILSSALTALKIKGETPEEIAGAAFAFRQHATPFPELDFPVGDSCGTGGDGTNTFNVSSTVAIVAAAAGLKIAKHGNRSISSKSGSADLMETLGITLDISPDKAAESLRETGMAFLFAPQYHSGVRHAVPVRNALKTRTIFNILGPLLNPAKPSYQLLGVYDPSLCLPIAKTLQYLGVERAMVVHGSGTDEIALHGETTVVEINGDTLLEKTLRPEDFGAQQHPLSALEGGEPEQNAQITRDLLEGRGTPAQRDAIAVNVAALLYLAGKADTLKEGYRTCQEILDSNYGMQTLARIIEVVRG
ncbi:anthranilate phosphoribosyltransferase [Algicola sagamiensis]|uniref:anthranilate phosphoribosyltransferase n=1 Tax=Algicola sagamiensis TaxID=163869 RepID=UPI0003680C53|nr:anthranilate phosphoribosyltransferase [Algicola sagamiensis]